MARAKSAGYTCLKLPDDSEQRRNEVASLSEGGRRDRERERERREERHEHICICVYFFIQNALKFKDNIVAA